MTAKMQSTAIEAREAMRGETADAEVRFAVPGDDGILEGTAVRFDVVDSHRSEFAPQAFANARAPIPMLWSHDPAQVIGSWISIEARSDGLAVKGRLNLAVTKAMEVRALLQAGDVTGLSVGFRTLRDERTAQGTRRVTQAELHEISIVAFPAVPGSRVVATRAVSATAAADQVAFVTSIRAATAAIRGTRA
ncbi:HK97 family phage prohead protease [Frigidibacter oleivorans]|uniref:HK97 family phage prohead protease n=1 Tax=Frigidibacter oleivorans TaxID=2487129 RepID=UPI000F8F724B|nr:HK97 family phage prohead protease [Frigidibacter oleivorans]